MWNGCWNLGALQKEGRESEEMVDEENKFEKGMTLRSCAVMKR